jgi:glycosyltransferase involved in cell wall biosynthesis
MKIIQPDQTNYFAFRNGVDLNTFSPVSEGTRISLREDNNVNDKFVVISVGHFIERKGHHLTIEALKQLPNVHLFLAGDGELDRVLRQQVVELSLEQQVTFLGAIDHRQLVNYYAMSDCMVLASSREGWANVLLESMACGTPVVATPIWGTPEVISEACAGVLTEDRSINAIARAIKELENNYPTREDVRTYAEKFSWDDTCDAQYNLFTELTRKQ